MKYLYYTSFTMCILLALPSMLRAMHIYQQPVQHVAVSEKILETVSGKADQINRKMHRASERYIARFKTLEQKMLRKLQKKDTMLAQTLTTGASTLVQNSSNPVDPVNKALIAYNGYLDSIQTAIAFLSANKQFTSLKIDGQQLPALDKLKEVQQQLRGAQNMERYLQERRQFYIAQLTSIGRVKELQKMGSALNRYKTIVQQYKAMLERPELFERRLLELLAQQKAFADFFSKHSLLSSMFRMPGANGDQQASIPGLQTRQLLQLETVQRLGSEANPSQLIPGQVTGTSHKVPDLKEQLARLQQEGHTANPQTATPNGRLRSVLQRLEFGANFQNTTASSYFPAYTDAGFTVAYRFSKNGQAGLGASAKIGWGKDIQHIAVTGQGASARSLFDYRLKGAFSATGGFELNYNQPFSSVRRLYYIKNWSQSGLIGISRTMPLGGKLVKETKIMLLWDFLSYNQVPRTQPLKFRIGYSFK